MSAPKRRFFPLVLTIVLLLIAASRILRLDSLQMDSDEVWSVWQTLGTPAQIIQWTPGDWPPLFYLLLGAWRLVVGIQPVALHMFSVLTFLLAAALIYRLGALLYGPTTGLIAVIVFAGFGYNLYLSLLIRGYIFILMLTVLSLWVALSYLKRPSLWHGAVLSLLLASMFYIHFTGSLAIIMVGIFTVILYPRKLLYWLLPGFLTSLIMLPGFVGRSGMLLLLNASRGTVVAQNPLPPLPAYLAGLATAFWGVVAPVWAVLFIVATIVIILRRPIQRKTFALAAWVAAPVALYILYPAIGSPGARHVDWITIGIAVWIGWGLSGLIGLFSKNLRLALPIAGSLLMVGMFLPIPQDYGLSSPPLGTYLKLLKENFREGDAVLVDPNFTISEPEMWDYYTQVYFPNGLPFITSPNGYRRVWYVTREGSRDQTIDREVQRGRVPGKFFGPWDMLFRLYEGPPSRKGVLFENGMRFHGAEVIENGEVFIGPLVRHEGETVQLRLWWSVDSPPPFDYSASLRVLSQASETPLAQVDGPPAPSDAPKQTSQWLPGKFYIEDRQLTLPYPMTVGDYKIYLTVYQWWDNQRIAAPGMERDKLLPVMPLAIKSFFH